MGIYFGLTKGMRIFFQVGEKIFSGRGEKKPHQGMVRLEGYLLRHSACKNHIKAKIINLVYHL